MLLEKYQASCCLVFVYSNQENSTWSTTKSKERMILIWFVDGLFVSPVMNSGVSGWDLSCKDLVALMDIKVHKMRQTLWTAHHVLFAFTMSELSGVFFYYMLHAITQTRSRENFNQRLLKEAGGSKGLTAFQRDIRPKDLWSKWFIFTESGWKHLKPQVWAESSERNALYLQPRLQSPQNDYLLHNRKS